jgi:alkylated DNA repair dioxygenase AlkB
MQLFKTKIELLDTEGELTLYKGHFDDALNVLNFLNQLEFNQNKITMFGKEHYVPRLELWFGHKSYSYTGLELTPQKFPVWLIELESKINALTGHSFNSVLINKYRDGNDYVSAHQDNEPELGENPIIASLSFGAVRTFRLKKLDSKIIKKEILLENGDLLIMGRNIQNHWKHELPKSKKIKSVRYNLTFRSIF